MLGLLQNCRQIRSQLHQARPQEGFASPQYLPKISEYSLKKVLHQLWGVLSLIDSQVVEVNSRPVSDFNLLELLRRLFISSSLHCWRLDCSISIVQLDNGNDSSFITRFSSTCDLVSSMVWKYMYFIREVQGRSFIGVPFGDSYLDLGLIGKPFLDNLLMYSFISSCALDFRPELETTSCDMLIGFSGSWDRIYLAPLRTGVLATII